MTREPSPREPTPPRDAADEDAWNALDDGAVSYRRPTLDPFHVDEKFIVFNKPAEMRVAFESDGRASFPDFHDETLEQIGPLFGILPVDDGVSGMMLLARNREIQQTLADQLVEGELESVCLALVRASFVPDSGVIETPLSRAGRRQKYTKVDIENGRPALTEWRVRDSFVTFALLECRPRTAAPEQVRVHLASVGMPPAVDRVNGGAEHLMLSSFKLGYRPSNRRRERPLIERPSLHVESIAFLNPATGEPLRYEAPAPRDFHATLNQLDRFGRVGR